MSQSQEIAPLPENQSPPVPANDPPEIVEFAAILNETNHFSLEQKQEIIAMLRQESPVMRSCIMANHLAAIRNASVNTRSAAADPNPIMQASHLSSIRGQDFGDTSAIRQASHRGDGGVSAESHAINHASNATENSQSVIRQVADQGARSNASFRINRLQSELDSPPRIITDTALPNVAAADDYATTRPQELPIREDAVEDRELLVTDSSQVTTDEMHQDMPGSRDTLRLSATRSPNIPAAVTNPESLPSQQPMAGNRAGGASRTRLGFAASGSRDSFIPPLLPEEDDDFAEAANASKIAMESRRGNLDDITRPESRSREDENYAFPIRGQNSLSVLGRETPSLPPETWEDTARRALNLLNTQIADSDSLEHKESLQDEINQRLMSLTLGNQRDAIRPIDGLPTELQEFWRNTLLGLSTMLDDVSIPDASHRFAVAQHHMQTANQYLQNLCPVRIRKLNFINQCDGFGVYETAPSDFRRGEPIFVYAEIDNLICKENDEGFYTQVSSSYEIIDVLGGKVTSGEFSKTGKHTQSRIRDVFLLWRVDLPENIMPGKYFLKLSVSDLNHPNHQFDQQNLELNVLSPLPNN